MADFLVIRGADLLDVDAGEVLGGRQLLIADGAVEAVLGDGEATPDGARVLDLSGLTILPGLIDCHSHLIGDMEFAGVPATTTSAAEEAMTGVRNARATIEAGFTTVRDVGTYRAFVDVALRDAIDAGWLAGPRMQCAGAYVTSPGGGGEVTGLALDVTLPADLRFGVVRSPAEARQKVRELVGGGADLIKLIVTGAVLTRGTRPDVVELDEATVRAAVEEASGPRRLRRGPCPRHRGDQGRDPGRRPVGRARLAHRRRGDRAARRQRHVLGRGHLRRRLDRGGRGARRVAGRDAREEPADDRCPAGGVPEGRRGGGPPRLRDGQRGLPARAQRPASCPISSDTG